MLECIDKMSMWRQDVEVNRRGMARVVGGRVM